MRVPAYRIPDRYVGPDGTEWLEHWAATLHRDLPFESIPKVVRPIITSDTQLEAAVNPHAK